MNIYDQMHENMPKEDLTNSFIVACNVGDIDALKSLLENPKYEQHIDVHHNNEAAFKWILFNNRVEVIRYLIVEYKIDKTEAMEEFLNNSKKEGIVSEAVKLFQVREMSDSLDKELVPNQKIDKKIKL